MWLLVGNIVLLAAASAEQRAAEARGAVNTVSQGSGADIAKTALAALQAALAAELPHASARIVHMVPRSRRPQTFPRHPPCIAQVGLQSPTPPHPASHPGAPPGIAHGTKPSEFRLPNGWTPGGTLCTTDSAIAKSRASGRR